MISSPLEGERRLDAGRLAEWVIQLGDNPRFGASSNVVLAESEAAECPEGDRWEIAGASQIDFAAAGQAAAVCDGGHGLGGVASEPVIALDAGLIDVQRSAGSRRAVEQIAAAVAVAVPDQHEVAGINASALNGRRRDETEGLALAVAEFDNEIERIDGIVALVCALIL